MTDSPLFAFEDDYPKSAPLPEDELTEMDHLVIESTYMTSYDELDENQQRRVRKILASMPEPIRDIMEGDHFTSAQINDTMDEVWAGMHEQDFPDEFYDGASIMVMGIRKRLGLPGGPDD